jgi:hypothetical protein
MSHVSGSKITSEAHSPWLSACHPSQLGFRAGVLVSLVYSLLRALLDAPECQHLSGVDAG